MAQTKPEQGCFLSDLQVLLKSGEGADVTFVVGDTHIPAHTQILAARSTVFAAMLRNNMQEAISRHIKITDMREVVLQQLLSFMYTDTAPQLRSVAGELLAAADKYDLQLLKKMCEQQMARDVSVENAAVTVSLAVLHSCVSLRNTAVNFIATHHEVMATAGWERMLRDSPGTAVEVCKQVAAQQNRLVQIPPQQPKATAKTSAVPQSSGSSIVAERIKLEMAARLMVAARCGRAEEVWALLAAGAPKDSRDSNGDTALHLAAANGHANTVKCLLKGGLDVNAVNCSMWTPLHSAAQRDDTDIIWMLVAASAQVNAQDNQGQTPLHVAAQKNSETELVSITSLLKNRNAHVVKVLLLAGARDDIKNVLGANPSSVATSSTITAFSSQ